MKNKKGIYLNMDKIKEIVRLYEKDFSFSKISTSCKISRTTVRNYVAIIKAESITYDKIKDLPTEEIYKIFKKNKSGRKGKKYKLDYKYIQNELHKKSVTIRLIWDEHIEQHGKDFYSYSRFLTLFRDWQQLNKISLKMPHKAGEKTYVDYSGQRFPIYKPSSDEVLYSAEIFVACLGASNYTFAKAYRSQKLSDWIQANVEMFNFFGGVTECIVPDNLKSAVTKADYYEPGMERTITIATL